jgi:cytoskeletal protein RodZ
MSDERKDLGELLKEKRRELNLTLKEVENVTSIRTGYLEAIEEGRIDQFVSGIYAQGFMKQYASYLGFDVDDLVREHPHAFKTSAEKHEFSYGIGTLEMRGSMGGGVKWFPNLLWAGLAAALLVLAWYLARFLGLL